MLGREDEIGSITVGKRADFVVLAADPLAVDPDTISEIPVLATWVDGEQVHQNDSTPAAPFAATIS